MKGNTRAAKLTIESVVLIKQHLMKKDLKQKEIALKFGVVPSVISKIKNGQRFSEVRIDEHGNYVRPEVVEILPEHFPIPSINEDEDKPLKGIEDGTTKHRVEFIEKYFRRKEPEADPYDDKATHIHYEPVGKKSRRFIFGLYKQYGWLFNREWNDFISEVMLSVTKKVMTFIPNDKDFDWSKVMTDGTKESSILHANINKAIRTDIREYANQINDSIQVQQDGVVGWSKPDMSSLDKLVQIKEGTESLSDSAGVTSSFWKMKEDYAGSQFLDWFSGNHEQLLTEGQVIYLNTMKYFQRDENDDYTVPYSEIPEAYKPFSQQSVEHNRRRIRERVEIAYESVKPVTLRQLGHDKEIQFWSSYMDLVEIDDDRIDEQGRLLSGWILQRIDYKPMIEMFWQLDAVDVLAIHGSGSEISNNILYKITDYVEQRILYLEELKKKSEKVVPFKRVKSEYGGLTQEEYRKRENQRKADELKAKQTGRNETVRFRSTPNGIYLIED
ncbi:helix-turn-helix domain-containing protein [Sporosarcina beigongshangi]|uniref:helix-turn-helix domain-containing protein n=1 Tax=Sporosarcina beigongshangi TaxID=2782538 RepID=UPI0019398B6D|nr:helix-turn-helix transcriptional regulator [Sporosarcina beigongshangi]